MQKHDIDHVIASYGDMLYRICFVMLRNNADAEDAVQEVLLKYFTQAPAFQDTEHEKAWLITVSSNQCRNLIRQRIRSVPTETMILHQLLPEPEECSIMEHLMEMPDVYRIVMLLHYVEGYKVEEIAEMIGKSTSAVKMRLSRGRELLKKSCQQGG